MNLPGLFHAFVAIYDVPDPAPWERRVVLCPKLPTHLLQERIR